MQPSDRPEIPPIPDVWTIHTDVSITRRKRYCIVADPQGRNRFMGRLISDAMDYIHAEEVGEFALSTENGVWLLRIAHAVERER